MGKDKSDIQKFIKEVEQVTIEDLCNEYARLAKKADKLWKRLSDVNKLLHAEWEKTREEIREVTGVKQGRQLMALKHAFSHGFYCALDHCLELIYTQKDIITLQQKAMVKMILFGEELIEKRARYVI